MKISIPRRAAGIAGVVVIVATGVVATAAPAAAAPKSELTVVVAPNGTASAPAGDIVVTSIHAAQKLVQNKGKKQDVRVRSP